MTLANKIYNRAKLTNDEVSVIVHQMDFIYLIRMTDALEQINEVHKQLEDGDVDGFDFGDQVYHILEEV